MDFLTALGQDVQITVWPTRKPHGEVSVIAQELVESHPSKGTMGGAPGSRPELLQRSCGAGALARDSAQPLWVGHSSPTKLSTHHPISLLLLSS
jgi:hypothetical protein